MFLEFWLESCDGEIDFDCVPELLREQAKEKAALLLMTDPGDWIEGVGYHWQTCGQLSWLFILLKK